MKRSFSSQFAMRVAVIYAIAALLYIFFSDTLLGILLADASETLVSLQILKGTLFVLTTSLLLFFVLQRELRRRQETETQYHDLFRANPNPMLIYDFETLRILEANAAAIATYGYLLEEFQQMTIMDIRPTEEKPMLKALLPRITRGINSNTSRHLKKNGTIMEVEITSHSIEWNGHNARVILIRDISDRKQAQEARREAQSFYRELQQEKDKRELVSRFTSMVVHEFRSPLTVIQTAADMLYRYPDLLHEKRENLFHRIGNSVHRLSEMTEQMLMINKLESGKITFQPELTDIAAFCKDMINELRQPNKAEVHYSDTGSHEILIDRNFIQHVMHNLVSNAIKYTPADKQVYVDLRVSEEKLHLIIRDEGIGIPPEDLEKLFEPFFRAKNAKNLPGTGLGLAIVKTYVEQYGGTIQCESRVGEGTTFTLDLPHQPNCTEHTAETTTSDEPVNHAGA